MDNPSTPGELTVGFGGRPRRTGHRPPRPRRALSGVSSLPQHCLLPFCFVLESSTQRSLGQQRSLTLYVNTVFTLLTLARMGGVLEVYHQDREKNHDCVYATGC